MIINDLYNNKKIVAEANDPNFVGFMNKALSNKVDSKPEQPKTGHDWYDNAPTMSMNNMPSYKHAFKFGMSVLQSMDTETKQHFAESDNDTLFSYLMKLARKKGFSPKYFVEEDMIEVPDLFSEIFHDPSMEGWEWADLLRSTLKDQGVAEGKRADTYHIVNKDGKPASLASYADKESAVKDRDAKHQGAEVRQLGPRGKVKGVSEASLGDYRKKAALSKATSQIDRFFGRDDPAQVAQADQTIAKRERGLARADARSKPYIPPKFDSEKYQRDLTAKYPNIDELVADAEKHRDPNYDRAEGSAYYAGREAEQNYQKLKQIQRVIQGLNESQADTKKKELGTGTGRINPDTGRPWTPSELKAKYANVDFDQDIRKAELKRLSDLAKQEKLKDKIKASLDDPRDTARDLAKSLINKGGLGMDFKPPAPTPVPPTPSPAPVTVQGQPPGFTYNNLAQQPGMTQYMQSKPSAAPKPAPNFAQGPTGYKTATTNVPPVATTTTAPPAERNDSDILQGLIQLQFSPKEAKAAIKQLPPNISTKDAIFRILQLQGKQMSESLTWSPNFNPGRSLYRRMKQDL